MKQDEIDSLLNSFFISKEELESRGVFREFIHSISSVLINDFTQNYLLKNPYLLVYLAQTDRDRLLKEMKSFFTFLLTAPVDEKYVQKINAIGLLHYTIKLEPAKLSYGFWAIGEVLDKLAKTNPIIGEHKSLITKILRFVEYLMYEGYRYSEKIQLQDSMHSYQNLNVQNELYIGLNIHKLNAKKVDLALSDANQHHLLDEISNNSNTCSFSSILKKLQDNAQYEYILGTSAKQIYAIHSKWHKALGELKKALKNKNTPAVKKHHTSLTELTNTLSTLLERSLKETLEDGQLSLRSGIQAMNKMTTLFHNKDYKSIEEHSSKIIIEQTIQDVVLSEFSWAIDEWTISNSDAKDKDKDKDKDITCITKTIRYDSQNIFISLRLKNIQGTNYLQYILQLLLEVLELHFLVQEREVSLINFAEKSESASKSKDIFLANMSHELRTPINAITGFSQILMLKKDTPATTKSYIDKINIAGNNLLELVNTILDFAKLESGKMQFNPSLSNISQVLNEVQTLISPMADKKSITLSMPNLVSLNLYIDHTLFKQALINLLSNAVKFTHKEGKVSLNISYIEANHTYRFEVKDTGVGLSEEDAKKLFQAFSQVENNYQKEHKGSGLGLMISKSIIEDLHKGKIWVESEKDKGSSFFIEMPTPMIESHTHTVQKAPKGSKHILIVEDSEEFQKIIIENLKDTHFLTITDTINKSKELLSKNTYDLLLLDFFLTDGISSEILHFMETENISIPSLVISAEDEIHITSSLKGSSNLQSISNKKDIQEICNSIREGTLDV